MPELTRPKLRHPNRWRWLALFAATAVFLYYVGRFHVPGRGFTALINFGEHHAARYLAEIDPATTYITPNSDGYDSQWYAQLAVQPDLDDPRLTEAIDNLPYRARRILFCWTAHGLGLGQPRWVLEAFALQNVLSWLLLGALLLRWLPPTNWGNVARWLAVMFSFGLAFSVRGSLVDGPGLLLIAVGVALLESGRPWLAAFVLGVNGLGKETCVLAGSALARPTENNLRGWIGVALRGLLVAAPLLLWTAYTVIHFGAGASDTGARNFAAPFAEFLHKAVVSARELRSGAPLLPYTICGLFAVLSLATQVLFLALRPRWRDAWWRIGVSFGLLMAVLGESVWEGYPSAATRVLLPMTLAFNLLLPRGGRWWPVFLLGNLSILGTPNFLRLPVGTEPPVLEAPAALLRNESGDGRLTVELAGPWFPSEQSTGDQWRWTGGDVELVVHNPHTSAVEATLTFGLSSRSERSLLIQATNTELWRGTASANRQEVTVPSLRLPPGETRIAFRSDRPAEISSENHDDRRLLFRISALKLMVQPRAASK
ncbi:MAG: hypothetical protein QM691_07445 [Opitutaceae bacterium]